VSIKNKRLFLLDMDGTIYLGDRLFDCTPRFFRHLSKIGAAHMFFTNNSSKSTAQYLAKLQNMGIAADYAQIISSTRATIAYLRGNYADKRLYALGTQAFVAELRAAGFDCVTELSDDIDALVMGFDTELNFTKLDDASRLLTRGVDYIATNPDLTCPTEYGYVPDCGSVAQMLKNATGREPLFIGKPSGLMVDMALGLFRNYTEPIFPTGGRQMDSMVLGIHRESEGREKSCECVFETRLLQGLDVPKDEILLVGDRLYTDIACGIAAGVDTALVLSGEATMEDLAASPHKPTYVFKDVGEIFSN